MDVKIGNIVEYVDIEEALFKEKISEVMDAMEDKSFQFFIIGDRNRIMVVLEGGVENLNLAKKIEKKETSLSTVLFFDEDKVKVGFSIFMLDVEDVEQAVRILKKGTIEFYMKRRRKDSNIT